MYFVAEGFGKSRPDSSVNGPGGDNRLVGRPAFSPDKARAENLSGSVASTLNLEGSVSRIFPEGGVTVMDTGSSAAAGAAESSIEVRIRSAVCLIAD